MLCLDEQLGEPNCLYEETLTRMGEWPYYRIHSLFLSTAIVFIRTNRQQHEKIKYNENQGREGVTESGQEALRAIGIKPGMA